MTGPPLGDDDLTPHPAPVHAANHALCVFIQDLVAALERHEIRLRKLLREVRLASEPVERPVVDRIIGELTDYHGNAFRSLQRGVP